MSCRQHIVTSWFYLKKKNYSASPSPLIVVSNPFIFNVTAHKLGFTPASLLYVFYMTFSVSFICFLYVFFSSYTTSFFFNVKYFLVYHLHSPVIVVVVVFTVYIFSYFLGS